MRDKRFIAEHRGGQLTRINHHKLIRWAIECSEHILPIIDGDPDQRLLYALHIAKEWENENVATGVAMKASVGAHAAARESIIPAHIAVARSIGQTVATAHMADHSPGGALYALKAAKLVGKSVNEELDWQISRLKLLVPEFSELIISILKKKSGILKIL